MTKEFAMLEAEILRLQSANKNLLDFARQVLRGCNSGNIVANRIVNMKNSDDLEMVSLAEIAKSVIDNNGGAA